MLVLRFMDARIEDLLVKKVDGEITKEEEKELNIWLMESDTHRCILREFEVVRQRLLVLREEFQPNVKERLQLIKRRGKRRVSSGKRWIWHIAASILFLGVCGYWMWGDEDKKNDELRAFSQIAMVGKERAYIKWADGEQMMIDNMVKDTLLTKDSSVMLCMDSNRTLRYKRIKIVENQTSRMHKIVIPNGGEYRMMLEDGSIVWLNSASSLEIPERFSTESRKVRLVGEAYFQVKKDTLRPFCVEMEGAEVRVLGTEFNVSAYKEDDGITATLVKGAVQVNTRGGKSVVLKPGQQASTGDKGIQVQDVDVSYVTSWVEGKFCFNNTRLEDIIRQISRWYSVKILFEDESLKEIRFSGAMLKFRPLDELIEMIESTSYVRFGVKDGQIVINKK